MSFFLENVHPFFLGGSFSYIVSSIESQASICTSQENNLDACPIKTLLEVEERAVHCEVTVHVSFLH